MSDKELTQLELQECLRYEEGTGFFFWIKRNSKRIKVGDKAGTRPNCDGYAEIMVNNVLYKAHRLAWLYVYGEWPQSQIDHINGDRFDNRIANLRDATPKENSYNRIRASKNNKTSLLGVVTKPNGTFYAEIRVEKKKFHLGSFPSAELAHQAYLEAKEKLHTMEAV